MVEAEIPGECAVIDDPDRLAVVEQFPLGGGGVEKTGPIRSFVAGGALFTTTGGLSTALG